uniref:Beta-xylanase n=1 Tax=uncultured bacterium 35A20 TaxID=1194347 RepID=K7PDY3_9BACT|nr:endo-1,4-beta-xylanase [uncultured bacterium 35A20]
MRIKQISLLLLILAGFLLFGCGDGSSSGSKNVSVEGIEFKEKTLTLVVGEKAELEYTIIPAEATTNVTWTTSSSSVVSVSKEGIAEAVGVTTGGNSKATSGAATGTATITVKTSKGGHTATITINTTTKAQTDIMSLPPLKETLGEHFANVGNIFNPSDATSASGINNTRLTRHFNILTMENNMKPSYLGGSLNGTTVTPSSTNIATAQRMVDAARASGFKVVGHTLLWHSQNAGWMNTTNLPAHNDNETTRQNSLTIMKNYITAVAGHDAFKGKIYSWDVLNEVFPDSGYTSSSDWKTVMRSENPWFRAIGSDFVYEGFLAARLADPNAILYYNDYNTDQASKAAMIRDMVRDVNQKYLSGSDKPAGEAAGRLLIEGIGMQEHHNTGVSASSIETTIKMFKALGVEIAVSELDVLGAGYSSSLDTGPNKVADSPITNQGLINQATKYNDYMKVYINHKDAIKRISIWGVTDNNSWRSAGLPLLFDSDGKAKPAYYGFIGAIE